MYGFEFLSYILESIYLLDSQKRRDKQEKWGLSKFSCKNIENEDNKIEASRTNAKRGSWRQEEHIRDNHFNEDVNNVW